MGNKSFKFKQFEIFHDKCAMKVGTDGVLLGAWAAVENSRKILDIGTGTGLIALMLAQRNRNAGFVAIEVEEHAVVQAEENVMRSPFASQIEVRHVSFQEFAIFSGQKFDHIVSNPPFFSKSLHSPDLARTRARHDFELSVFELIEHAGRLILPDGKLSIVFPYNLLLQLESIIGKNGWQICRRTDVFPTLKSKHPKRVLLELQFTANASDPVFETLYIERERHVYTDEYVELTKEFYLKM